MKTAIIFADGVKQIVFTPENNDEKQALKLFTPDDDIDLLITYGRFGENHFRPFTARPRMCMGNFLRIFEDSESIIFVLSPKKKEK